MTRRPSEATQALWGVVALLAVMPLAFGMKRAHFAPFAEPSTWAFLGLGLLVTVEAAVLAILASLPLATGLALGRLAAPRWLRWPSIALIELLRALPRLLLIVIVYRWMSRSGLPLASVDVAFLQIQGQSFVPVVVALAVSTAAVNAEVLRAAILGLDPGQNEAAKALGLGYAQRLRYVILPQAFRRALPPLVGQLTTLLKDTSLGYVATLLDLMRRGKIVYSGHYNPLETLYVVALLYFAVNYALGQVAGRVERRFGGGST